jgi:hypothetical protein
MRAWWAAGLVLGCTGSAEVPTDTDTDPPVGPVQTLEPASLDFRTLAVGESASADVIIRNEGDEPLDIYEIRLTTDDTPFELGTVGQGQRIRAGSAGSFVVTFAPDRPDTWTSAVEVQSNVTFETPAQVPLTASAVAPALEVEPALVEVEADTPARVPLVLRNRGDAPLTLYRMDPEGDPGFGVDPDPDTNGSLPFTLAPFDPETGRPTRTVFVTWLPRGSDASDVGNLAILSDAWPERTVRVELRVSR